MEPDFTQIQDMLTGTGKDIPRFAELVQQLLTDGEILSPIRILQLLLDYMKWDWGIYRIEFLQILGIAIGAAMLRGLTDHFRSRQVSETGFFVIYLLLFGILTAGFVGAWQIAVDTIGVVVNFLQALIPAYFLSVAFCTGSATALVFYQGILLAIGLVDMVILQLLLPLVNVYLVLMLVDQFQQEKSLNQIARLIRMVVIWGARTLFGMIIGIQTIQGMLLPLSDKLKRSLIYKAAEMLPGVGNAIGGTAETILSTGMLLKNAVGAAGLLFLGLLTLAPIVNLLIQCLLYRVSAGILQPVSDKRIIGSLESAAEAARLLLYLTGITILLFALAISVVAISTGVN